MYVSIFLYGHNAYTCMYVRSYECILSIMYVYAGLFYDGTPRYGVPEPFSQVKKNNCL